MNNNNKVPETLRKLAPIMDIGIVFVVFILAGVFFGKWFDEKFLTSPWGIVTGSLLGIVLGFVHFFRIVLTLDQDGKEKSGKQDRE